MTPEPDRPHVAVCICTFRRAELLRRLLERLLEQRTEGRFDYSIVVCDNDRTESSRATVEEFARGARIATTYVSEPRQNIALARNRALQAARGDFVAFIDDDEFPVPDWLRLMLETCAARNVSGVLGPVRPHFDAPPPRWIVAGRFCERPEHPTGRVMPGDDCRTGNVLLRRSVIDPLDAPFDEKFGNGGEDVDFFRRLTASGHTFVWCNEAVAYETVPPSRQTRSYMLKRALLRGKNRLKLPTGRWRYVATSLVAVPAYAIILPVASAFGHHRFMKYLIKMCDHGGRLLAVVRLNPVDRTGFESS